MSELAYGLLMKQLDALENDRKVLKEQFALILQSQSQPQPTEEKTEEPLAEDDLEQVQEEKAIENSTTEPKSLFPLVEDILVAQIWHRSGQNPDNFKVLILQEEEDIRDQVKNLNSALVKNLAATELRVQLAEIEKQEKIRLAELAKDEKIRVIELANEVTVRRGELAQQEKIRIKELENGCQDAEQDKSLRFAEQIRQSVVRLHELHLEELRVTQASQQDIQLKTATMDADLKNAEIRRDQAIQESLASERKFQGVVKFVEQSHAALIAAQASNIGNSGSPFPLDAKIVAEIKKSVEVFGTLTKAFEVIETTESGQVNETPAAAVDTKESAEVAETPAEIVETPSSSQS